MGNRFVIGRINMDGILKSYIVIIGLKIFIGLVIDYLCKVFNFIIL